MGRELERANSSERSPRLDGLPIIFIAIPPSKAPKNPGGFKRDTPGQLLVYNL